jgi:hypothetical protein
MSTYSDEILTKLQTNTQKFYSALDDFSSSYLNYKMYPDYSEYRQIYANSQGVIESLQAELFISTNDVERNIGELNRLISNLNTKLITEKEKYTTLTSELNSVSSDSNGSGLLALQSKTLYSEKYIYNITLVIGICVLLYSLFKVYSKKTQQMPRTL